MNDSSTINRRRDALAVARELVGDLEKAEPGIDRPLMKAQRLARTLRDTDAQKWLDYEMRGYPPDINLKKELGTCAEYAHRWFPDRKAVFRTSLPELEARVAATQQVLAKLNAPTFSQPTADFLELQATIRLVALLTKQIASARDAYIAALGEFNAMRSHLYRYAADTLIALEFGSVAEELFQSARRVTDEFVRSVSPKAAEQLLSAEERLAVGDSEALSACLTSCRRVLSTIADSIYPPRQEPYVDQSGRTRKVGQDEYLNRLLAFLETSLRSRSSEAIISAQIGHLSARLDAVYAKACKGVHDDVSIEEARLVLIQTYLFIGEVAKAARGVQPNSS